jgi:hypothetical protein
MSCLIFASAVAVFLRALSREAKTFEASRPKCASRLTRSRALHRFPGLPARRAIAAQAALQGV